VLPFGYRNRFAARSAVALRAGREGWPVARAVTAKSGFARRRKRSQRAAFHGSDLAGRHLSSWTLPTRASILGGCPVCGFGGIARRRGRTRIQCADRLDVPDKTVVSKAADAVAGEISLSPFGGQLLILRRRGSAWSGDLCELVGAHSVRLPRARFMGDGAWVARLGKPRAHDNVDAAAARGAHARPKGNTQ
jgi:hypothetical protein